MKLKYIFVDSFKYWIADLPDCSVNPWSTEFYVQHMQQQNDWFDEVELNGTDTNKALFTFLDLGENATVEEGKVVRGAFTYSVYKLIGGWQFLDAGASASDLNLEDGDFLLIDSSFKPSRGVIATPRPLYLPKSFSSFVQSDEFSAFRVPYVKICYAAECQSIGLDFRNQPELLEKIDHSGFSVSLDETKRQPLISKHPYLLNDDTFKQVLFDALGWYNYMPKPIAQYRAENPHLSWIFNQGFLGFIKVAYSNYRNYDPNKYLYIGLDADYHNTLKTLMRCIENIESYRQQHLEELREIILDCIPHMKLEKTSSYHVMLEQIMRQKTLGLMSEEEARRISHQEAYQQMAKIDLTDLFYEQCTKELGEKARILLV
ncbi:MAG: hypothetical protein ACK5CY_00760 [Bacteroidia bacterium]